MDIASQSPAMLIYKAYDEAILSLRKAVEAIAAGDIEARFKANNKAADIVAELAVSLDFEHGGEVAERLYELYGYLLRTLPFVDIDNDPKPAQDAIALLEPMRNVWGVLASQNENELERVRDQALRALAAQDRNRATAPVQQQMEPEEPIKIPA